MAYFCGVKLPTITRVHLLSQISNLKNNHKKTLYFLYSEFLLRANRNQSYQQVLQKADISAIDGRGLEWANQMLTRKQTIDFENPIFQTIIFGWNLFVNVITGFWVIVFKGNLANTANEVILGRDFVYDLLVIAKEKRWRVAIVGGSQTLESKLKQIYPEISFSFWRADYNSDLMRDLPAISRLIANNFDSIHGYLSEQNLYSEFPNLLQAKDFLRANPTDLVLVCLGGASGKQEFFIKDIQKDPQISFTLATGIGAGLDHLGSGNKQKRVPKWLENLGLEAFYRVFSNPKRARRIWDSLFTLWWWTSLQPLIKEGEKVSLKNL